MVGESTTRVCYMTYSQDGAAQYMELAIQKRKLIINLAKNAKGVRDTPL